MLAAYIEIGSRYIQTGDGNSEYDKQIVCVFD